MICSVVKTCGHNFGLSMKNTFLALSVILFVGCSGGSHNLITSTTDPVISTDVAGEFVVQARDLTPIVGTVKGAEENATDAAIRHCNGLGQLFKKRYVITSPSAGGKWADATLHFRCVAKAA